MKKSAELYTMYRILIAIVVLPVHIRHHFTLPSLPILHCA